MNMIGANTDPTTAGVQVDWGDANEEVTEIETRFEIPTPNIVEGRLHNFGVGYEVGMNGITMASAERDDVYLNPDGTVVCLDAEMDNQRIPEWWVTHVNNGEESTISLEPHLRLPELLSGISARARAPSRSKTVETDFLGCIENDEPREKTVFGRTLFTVEGIRADWGEATVKETPVDVVAEVENPHPFPLSASRVEGEVLMNGVKVGEGSTADVDCGTVESGGDDETETPSEEGAEEGVNDGSVKIPAESRELVDIRVTVENQDLPEWWPTHVENGEDTEISVVLYAVVGAFGRGVRVPVFRYEDTFETDFLV